MRFDHVILIGVGGTGSHLLEPLTRLLAYHSTKTDNITIIDGDIYEEKNQERQLFDESLVGKNKAEAACERITFAKHITAIPVAGYINKIDFTNIILGGIKDVRKKNILVITAVDNHATRKDIICSLDEGKLENFVLIAPGNGLSHGQVIVHVKQNGKELTLHPFKRYDDIANPQDRIPGGCAAQAPSTPQLITANAAAALGTLFTVSALLDNKTFFEELAFDCEKMKLVPFSDPIVPVAVEVAKPDSIQVEAVAEIKVEAPEVAALPAPELPAFEMPAIFVNKAENPAKADSALNLDETKTDGEIKIEAVSNAAPA